MFAIEGNKNQSSESTGNDKWKADAFLNVYIPSKNGSEKKVGAIKLYKNKANDRQVIDFLSADEGNLEILKSKLILKFTNMEDREEDPLDL